MKPSSGQWKEKEREADQYQTPQRDQLTRTQHRRNQKDETLKFDWSLSLLYKLFL
jgi:hypothetical protein